MSVQALTWVFDHSRSEGTARLVLLAIANHASSEGAESWPSTETIAREARCSSRTVFRSIDELKSIGELDWVPGGGRKKSNYYWLPAFRNYAKLSVFVPRNHDNRDKKLCHPVTKTMTPVSYEPSLTVIEPDVDHDGTPNPDNAARARELIRMLSDGFGEGNGADELPERHDQGLGITKGRGDPRVERRTDGVGRSTVDEEGVIRLPVEPNLSDPGDHPEQAGGRQPDKRYDQRVGGYIPSDDQAEVEPKAARA